MMYSFFLSLFPSVSLGGGGVVIIIVVLFLQKCLWTGDTHVVSVYLMSSLSVSYTKCV